MRQQIVMIGGGASGLVASIQAARQGAFAVILEHRDRVGKKILSTGNGKCNLTNRFLDENCYRSSDGGFPYRVLEQFGVKETLKFFESLGVMFKEKNGYVYPASEQASAVLDVLRMEAVHLGVEMVCDCQVKGIERKGEGEFRFQVRTSMGDYAAHSVILATGSKAAPVTGSDGSGYELARELGHKVIKPLPALVQLRCDGKFYKQLAGIRTEALLTLCVDGEPVVQEQGELQLTDYGISGIPVFQISRYASQALDRRRQVTVKMNFMPSMNRGEMIQFLIARQHHTEYRPAEEFLTGAFHKKLSRVWLQFCGIGPEIPVNQINSRQIEALADQIISMETRVKETNPFANAQVCCGGVDPREINENTMESKLVPGLYLVGELIDVDGICGGYNLQWAWSSGSIAGIRAGRGAYDSN